MCRRQKRKQKGKVCKDVFELRGVQKFSLQLGECCCSSCRKIPVGGLYCAGDQPNADNVMTYTVGVSGNSRCTSSGSKVTCRTNDDPKGKCECTEEYPIVESGNEDCR